MTRRIFVASPGTGKTTKLIREVGTLLAKGIPPSDICFTTFTRHAAEDAVKKAVKSFGIAPKELPYFRTTHSLCFRAMGCPNLVENVKDFYYDLHKMTGVATSFKQRSMTSDIDPSDVFEGDLFLQIHNNARNRVVSATTIMNEDSRYKKLNKGNYDLFIKKYGELKKDRDCIDYTDMLQKFLDDPDRNLPIHNLIVDEAQDITRLQKLVLDKIGRGCDSWYAGDDKQSIYQFNGGDPMELINMEGERTILDQSYRLPSEILKFSEKIAGKIKNKTPYAIKPIREGGKVSPIQSLQQLDLSHGSWLLLARLNKDLQQYKLLCDTLGYKYINPTEDDTPIFEAIRVWTALTSGEWLPLDDFKAVLPYLESGKYIRRGAKKMIEDDQDSQKPMSIGMLEMVYGLTTKDNWHSVFRLPTEKREVIRRMVQREGPHTAPRIRIATIHGSKGLEAENVCLCPKLSPACMENMDTNADGEHRCMYVAATRAKENLFILQGSENEYKF